jgi:hypothetical protein
MQSVSGIGKLQMPVSFLQMVQGGHHQDRTFDQHAWRGGAHDRSDSFPHIGIIAVVRVHKTGGTFFGQKAFV